MNAHRPRKKVKKALAIEWDQSEESPPTPETVAKLKSDAVRKLIGRKHGLTELHWDATIEIRTIREALGRGLFPIRTLGPELDVGGPTNAPYRDPLDRLSRYEEAIWRERYKPWSAEMKAIAHVGRAGPVRYLAIVEHVVIDNIGTRQADNMLGFRNGRTLAYLREALQRYAEIAQWAQKPQDIGPKTALSTAS